MNNRFVNVPGKKNVSLVIKRFCGILSIGAAFIATPLFSQEPILPVGNGNVSIAMESSDGTLLWKSPGTEQQDISAASSQAENSTDKLKAILTEDKAVSEVDNVRLVRFEESKPAVAVSKQSPAPSLDIVSANSTPVTKVAMAESRDSSKGQTVPFQKQKVDKPVAESPFKSIANSKYTDQCPDPRTLPKIKELSYKVVPQPGLFPESCPLPDEYYERKAPTPTTFYWKASSLCHKPVYFEDVQLERYGNTVCPLLQPVISRVRFWLTIPVLPYAMGVTPPNECVYELGYYRPGSCAPHMLNPIPISLRAGLIQAGAVVGAAYLIP